MYPVTAAFLAALRAPHRSVIRAEVWDGGTLVGVLPVVDGQVTVEGSAAIRRRCDVTLASPEWLPTSSTSALAPYGNEIRLYRGLRYPSGEEEMVPLGVFGISDAVTSQDRNATTLQVTAYDRARKVARARWTSPYVIASGTNFGTAIRDLIYNRVPQFGAANFAFSPTTNVTPLMVLGTEPDHDPWKIAQDMAESIGMVLYFDVAGVAVLRPMPDPTTDPIVETYAEGEAKVLGLQRSHTDEGVYNRVVVTGEALTGAPVRSEAVDAVTTSPTYYLGDFGDVPYFFTSKLISTQAQADEVAAAILRRVLGGQEQISFPAIVNPAHEAGDVISLTVPGSNVDDVYVLDSFRLPLSVAGAMEATTRKRRVV